MLHTKSQGHRPGSEEEVLKGFLPYMDVTAILVMWQDHLNKVSYPRPKESPYEILV